MYKLFRFKAVYYFCRFIRILATNVFSIFSIFPALLWIAGYYFLYDKEGSAGVFTAFLNDLSDIKVFILAFYIWVLWNVILAVYKTFVMGAGQWFQNRFVFDSLIPVFTTLVRPEDDGKFIEYKIPDVQRGATVGIQIECYGGLAKVTHMLAHPISEFAQRTVQGSFLLSKSGKTKLAIYCPKNSDPTIVRVYMVYWEV